ncbi:hypothetical protein [Streptomyces sp. E1N211]|uniref:hypothetical protein n=1 Tax=Streptomyces sp. E1N211 TaxID=1851876 RepID=UPI001F4D7614|nr:hypothetical protein [Streptomyces sp. E1N211]
MTPWLRTLGATLVLGAGAVLLPYGPFPGPPGAAGVAYGAERTPGPDAGDRTRTASRSPSALDEAEVRRVLASLDMDPAITTEVRTEDGRVGILLSPPSDGYSPTDCVLAVVGPGETDVWMPPRIQRMPGEGGCSAGNALHPLPPPH